jgi:hypothetical protein
MTRFQIRTYENYSGEGQDIVKISDDGTEWLVPLDPANSDYQEYLASLEATEPEAE